MTEAAQNQSKHYLQLFVKLIGEKHKFARLLEIGEEPIIAPLTPEESKLVSHVRRLVRPKRKQCFANCQQAILAYGAPFRYVEGFYTRCDLPLAFEHAWLTLNGKLVELTPNLPKGDYFGVAIEEDLIREYLTEGQEHGPITNDMDLGWKYTQRIFDV